MPDRWLLLTVCGAAAVTDIFWRRVPNLWLLSAFFTGMCLAGAEGCAVYLLRAAAVFAALYPVWRLGMTGAGDVKLCSVMAAWMGIRSFVACLVFSLFFGGLMAAVHMLRRRNFRRRFSYFFAWLRQCISSRTWVPYMQMTRPEKDSTIPFSAALSAGCLLWVWKLL